MQYVHFWEEATHDMHVSLNIVKFEQFLHNVNSNKLTNKINIIVYHFECTIFVILTLLKAVLLFEVMQW
jgi:hypothetical protein